MAEKSVTLNPGEGKTVSFEVVPHEAKDYQVSVNGLTGSFKAISAPPSGEILEVTWKRWKGVDEWHPFSDPMPSYTDIIHRFKIGNTGKAITSFKVGYYRTNYGAGWRYSKPIDIKPGEEGYIEWALGSGRAGTYTTTWYLFGDGIEVDSITVTTIVV